MTDLYEPRSRLRLGYTLDHPDIPLPLVGYQADFRQRHSHITGLLADQRACPAIKWRSGLGLTLSMPYTVEISATSIRVTQFRSLADEKVYEAELPTKQEMVAQKTPHDPEGRMKLPRFGMSLPFGMRFFTLGDHRVGSWVLDSGVRLVEPLPLCNWLLTPLPNERYDAGYTVGQAVMVSLKGLGGRLRIGFDLDDLEAAAERYVRIRRGTPMVQWLPIDVPEIELLSRD